MSQYPRYLYHKDHGKLLVTSEEQEQALGHEWVDSPAKVNIPFRHHRIDAPKPVPVPVVAPPPSDKPTRRRGGK